MLSATRAHSSDSIAPNTAKVIAGRNKPFISSQLNEGTVNSGKPCGIPPKRLPIVSTSKPVADTSNVATTKATIEPGIKANEPETRGNTPASAGSDILRFITACQAIIKPSDNNDTITAEAFQVGKACHSVFTSAKNSAGTLPSICKPKKSLICERPINTAIPLVKPIITDTGINLISTPIRKKPISHSITPDIKVANSKPLPPYCSTMPYTITINAPAGPPI